MGTTVSKTSIIRKIAVTFFFLLPIYLNVFTVEAKNLLFIGYSFLALVGILLIRRRIPVTVTWLSPFLVALLTLSFILNTSSAETMSFLYSVFYVVAYIIIISNFKAEVSEDGFISVVKALVIAFFVTLVIGQGYVMLGFFKAVFITKGNIHGPFGTLFEVPDGFRYYSLSTEPSYAAFIVVVLLFVYSEYVERKGEALWRGRHVLITLMCLYMVVSFQSGYGIILMAMFLFFKLKLRTAFAVAFAGVTLFFVAVYLELPAVTRFTTLIEKFDIRHIESIREADLSASFRVLPFYYYVTNIDPLNYHFYFGYGAASASKFLIPFLFKVPVDSYEGGFLPQFIYDYGLIFFILFLFFVRRESIVKLISFPTFVIVLMMTNANFNTQLFWFIVTCFALNKWYIRSSQERMLEPPLEHMQPVT